MIKFYYFGASKKSKNEGRKERKEGGREERRENEFIWLPRGFILTLTKNRLSIYITSHFVPQKNEGGRALWVLSQGGPILPLTC